jgi:hypothetical protein
MNAQNDIDKEKPLDPETERMGQRLKKFGAVFMGLNMLALMAVLGAIVYKLSSRGEPEQQVVQGAPMVPSAGEINGEIDLPDGTEVLSASQNGSQLLLNVRTGNGEQALWFYDLSERRITGKLAIR